MSTSIIGCEGLVGGAGVVIDSNTMEPVHNVRVRVFLNNHHRRTFRTDSVGAFDAVEFVGCVPSCPNARVEFSHPEYNTVMVDFDRFWSEDSGDTNMDSIIILLSKTKRPKP